MLSIQELKASTCCSKLICEMGGTQRLKGHDSMRINTEEKMFKKSSHIRNHAANCLPQMSLFSMRVLKL